MWVTRLTQAAALYVRRPPVYNLRGLFGLVGNAAVVVADAVVPRSATSSLCIVRRPVPVMTKAGQILYTRLVKAASVAVVGTRLVCASLWSIVAACSIDVRC